MEPVTAALSFVGDHAGCEWYSFMAEHHAASHIPSQGQLLNRQPWTGHMAAQPGSFGVIERGRNRDYPTFEGKVVDNSQSKRSKHRIGGFATSLKFR